MRPIWFPLIALIAATSACADDGDGGHGEPTGDSGPAGDSRPADAMAAIDAAPADASPFACDLARTRQAVSLAAPVAAAVGDLGGPCGGEPNGAIEVGGYCDAVFTCGATAAEVRAIEEASPRFTCGPAPGWCSFEWAEDEHGDITDDVMAELCAVTLVIEPTHYVDCVVYI